ncbi:hypothetical protein BH23GEM4_BH23GEM4_09310 [soil metagenome]
MTIAERIEGSLDTLRPALRADGCDVEFVDYDGDAGVARVRLTGACSECPISVMTMKQGIERRVKQDVPEVQEVIAV